GRLTFGVTRAGEEDAVMADPVKCLDDPATILRQRFCLSGLSKNLKGRLKLAEKDEQRCEEPACRTLKTIHALKVDVRANRPCDSRLGQALSGTLSWSGWHRPSTRTECTAGSTRGASCGPVPGSRWPAGCRG